jgi:uncharacterized protein (TIGR03083 family)
MTPSAVEKGQFDRSPGRLWSGYGVHMQPHEHLTRLEPAMTGLREVLADGELSAEVPGCPGWTLADLGAHVGGVYRFATAGLVERRGVDIAEPGFEARDELLGWFDTGAAALLATLRAVDERDAWGEPAWTLAPPHTAAFWARRQHHETVLHLHDALGSQGAASGAVAVIDPECAADGVHEVVTMFLPRQLRLGRLEPLVGTLELRMPGFAPLRLGEGRAGDGSDAVLEGDPAAVLLALWKRLPAGDPALRVTGDREVAERILAAPITP